MIISLALITVLLLVLGKRGVDIATVLALPVAVVGVLVALRQRSDDQVNDALRDLAREVRVQRQLFIDQALGHTRATACLTVPARVGFADPEPDEPISGVLRRLPVQWQETSGEKAGTIEDVASFYQGLPNGRLVVLGEPGAGKTFLLSHLVLSLIRERGEDRNINASQREVAIPVFLSLTSCWLPRLEDSTADQLCNHLHSWMASRISQDYKIRPVVVSHLLKRGQIIPVLDGLDEVDSTSDGGVGHQRRPRACAILHALNADHTRPIVLACRAGGYDDISSAHPSHPGTLLASARHVVVRPLEPVQVCDYLHMRVGDGDGHLQGRWKPVAEAVAASQSISQVLSSPWQLFLTVTAYSSEDSNPSELCSMSEGEIREYVIRRFVHAVVTVSDQARRMCWTSTDATIWLRNIAQHQQYLAQRYGVSETEIGLGDLWSISNRRYVRLVPIVGVLPSVITSFFFMFRGGLIGKLSGALLLLFSLLCGICSLSEKSPLKRLDLYAIRTRRGRRRLLRAMAGWLSVGLVVGVAGWLALGLAGGLAVGLAVGLAGWLAGELQGEVSSISSPSELARQCISHVLLVGLGGWLVIGMSVGLVYQLAYGLPGGVAYGLVGGLAIGGAYGLAFENGNVWFRYWWSMRSAARQGILPKRPTRFLDWCLEVGLMRMAGSALEFRHREHQEWLLRATLEVGEEAGKPLSEICEGFAMFEG